MTQIQTENISTSINNVYRIVDFALLKLFKTNSFCSFGIADNQKIATPIVNPTILEKTVWNEGEFAHRINKFYSSTNLVPVEDLEISEEQYTICQLVLKQGFSWKDIFGLHVIIKGLNDDQTYISQIFNIDDCEFSENKELIDGSFWTEVITFKIPRNDDEFLKAMVTPVYFDEIQNEGGNIGYIYNYPSELEPLIAEKPIADFIQTNIVIKDNQWITVSTFTTENKTLEQSILDYFQQDLAQITIAHSINFGNDTVGFKTLIVRNGDNEFLPITIGLDLTPFKDAYIANPNMNVVNIFVSTEIMVNGKLMKRENQINTDLFDTLNPLLLSEIKNPDTIFPVVVNNVSPIVQTVIETKTERQIVAVNKPIYAELIKDDIIVRNLSIVIEKVVIPAYLVLAKTDKQEEQIILNKSTADNVYYFDLGELTPIIEETKYKLINATTNAIIGIGKAFPES